MFDLGDVWNLTREAVGSVGVLANATTAALTITLPDGTAVTPTVANPPTRTGVYRYDYTPTVAGRHLARWLLTFSDGYALADTDTLDVRPLDPGGIVSLSAAKQHLNITGDSSDDELRGWVAAVTVVLEKKLGPCLIRDFQTLVYGAPSWFLPKRPVIGITAVTAINGRSTPPALGDLYPDPGDSGEVLQIGTAPISCGPWLVEYTAGRAVIPINIVQATLIILKHLWETQRAGDMNRGRMSFGGDDDLVMVPGIPWAIPKRAVELIQDDFQRPGIA